MKRSELAQFVRELRKTLGCRNVRLLSHIEVKNGQLMAVKTHLKDSIQKLPGGKSLFLWNDAVGSTRAIPLCDCPEKREADLELLASQYKGGCCENIAHS